MEWIGVKDGLPEEPKRFEQSVYDVWVGPGNYRYADADFRDGKFWALIEDSDGDFSHEEEIENVTHWMTLPEPPKSE